MAVTDVQVAERARETTDRGHVLLDSVASAYDEISRIVAQRDEARARADDAERNAAILASENDHLRVQVNQLKGERDHYHHAFAGLQAQMHGVAAFVLQAIETAVSGSYGNRRPTVNAVDEVKQPPVPTFLTDHSEREDHGPRTLQTLADVLIRPAGE